MARLRINWSTLQQVAPEAAATGEAEAQKEARALRAEKPMMIYITDDDPANKMTRKLEQIVFANEQVGIGAKFFEAIKMTSGNALQDRILKDAGEDTPRLVFMSRDYKVSKVLQGSGLSAGKLLKAMKNLAKAEYVNSFDKMVRGYIKLLNDLDRLEGKKAQLADARARLQAKPSKTKEKKIAREEAAYEKAVEAWNTKEKELLKFRRKGDPKPEA